MRSGRHSGDGRDGQDRLAWSGWVGVHGDEGALSMSMVHVSVGELGEDGVVAVRVEVGREFAKDLGGGK